MSSHYRRVKIKFIPLIGEHPVTKTVHVADADFESKVINSELPVLVDFWADWCAPCKAIAPILEEVAEQQAGKLTVAKLNIDEGQQVASQYGIRSIPTLMVFKGGKVENTYIGALSKGQLEEFIASSI